MLSIPRHDIYKIPHLNLWKSNTCTMTRSTIIIYFCPQTIYPLIFCITFLTINVVTKKLYRNLRVDLGPLWASQCSNIKRNLLWLILGSGIIKHRSSTAVVYEVKQCVCWKKVLWKSAAISIAKSLWLHKQLLSTRLQYPGAISSETRETCYCNAKIPGRHIIIIFHRNVKSKVLSNLFCCVKCHINWYPLIHISHTTTENILRKVRIIEKSKCITESFFFLFKRAICMSKHEILIIF